jgi:hypothetical protein
MCYFCSVCTGRKLFQDDAAVKNGVLQVFVRMKPVPDTTDTCMVLDHSHLLKATWCVPLQRRHQAVSKQQPYSDTHQHAQMHWRWDQHVVEPAAALSGVAHAVLRWCTNHLPHSIGSSRSISCQQQHRTTCVHLSELTLSSSHSVVS